MKLSVSRKIVRVFNKDGLIYTIFNRPSFQPISIFTFFDFDVTLYFHFSRKTPQWGLKMTMRMFY